MAITVDGNYTYIGGNFTHVGPYTGFGVKLTAVNDKIDKSFPLVNGEVRAVVPDGSGGWYIGGNFTKVGDSLRNNLARINSDGSVNPWDPNVEGLVYTIAVYLDEVYIGGLIYSVGGIGWMRNIFKLSSKTGAVDPYFAAKFDREVNSIAVSGGEVYAGGSFTTLNGINKNYIAKLNSQTGAADPAWDAGANDAVNAISVDGSDIYVGGRFTSIGGAARNRLAKLNAMSGTADPAWKTDADNLVRAIAVYENNVYVGGDFAKINNMFRGRLAKLNNKTGALDGVWDAKADSIVKTLTVGGSYLYVGGTFKSLNEIKCNNIGKLHILTGAADPAWMPNTASTVNSIAVSRNDVYIGGKFHSVGGLNRNRLAKLNNLTGEADPVWAANADNEIYAITVYDNSIYVGGAFSSIGGLSRKCIARLNIQTGAVDPAWDQKIDGSSITSITVSGTDMFVGGGFNSIGGMGRAMIAKLNGLTGTVDKAWNAETWDLVKSIAVNGSDVYVGGEFTVIGQAHRFGIAKLNSQTGTADPSWKADARDSYFWGNVKTVAVFGNDVYVGGEFDHIGGVARDCIAKLDTRTGAVDSLWKPHPDKWIPSSDNIICKIAVNESGIYVVGYFGEIGRLKRYGAAKLDSKTGAADPAWDAKLNDWASIVTLNGSDVYLGGKFTGIKGMPQPHFALFSNKSLPVELNSVILPLEYRLSQNYPNPFNPSTAIRFEMPENSAVSVKIYDMLGREVRELINEDRSAGSHTLYWKGQDNSGQTVSSGVYLYRLQAGSYSETKKMNFIR